VAEYWDGDIPWATPRDLAGLEGPNLSDTPRKLTSAGLKSCSAALLPPGSVLFSSRAPIGHVAINSVPMATNQGFKSLVPEAAELDNMYLYWWLRSHKEYLQSLGNGATFKEVSKAAVSRIRILLPPLPEQRRIAQILGRTDALRAKRRASIASIESLATAMFLESFGDPIQNPNDLPLCELVNLIDPKRPITYGILKPGPDVKDGVPYVRVVDMKAGGIDTTGLKHTSPEVSHAYRRSLLDGGDLLMSIRGHVGRYAIVPDELRGANITQDTARLAVTGASPRYVLECLRTPAFKRWMARHTKGVAVTGINLGDVKRMPIPMPPSVDQEQFARRVAAISELTRRLSRSFTELDALFASLRHRAFRGEL
jgi:type I restriction enzyme, S subunit